VGPELARCVHKYIGDGDIFHGLNLEEKEEGEAQFELDRAEILTFIFFS
jgi:hypothetical protein